MRFRFWKSKSRVQPDTLAWNAMVAVTDPEWCWKIGSTFRKTSVPGSVVTCELAFLMGSVVRGAISTVFSGETKIVAAVKAAEAAYFKTFDDQSNVVLPAEMKAVYGNARLNEIARAALKQYFENNDDLYLNSSLFINRIRGDPRMAFEVMPLLQKAQRSVEAALRGH